ncbi:MAG: prepilin-type N-terminal cleavage/methylation domain-containing protein [bacterium]|nr:prepilin-type N-terminal cleavage/methylation domain-containing protein [bacterium]
MRIISLQYKRGFTLIELLMVVALISLLSSLIATSVFSSRIKANDARRMSDLEQVRNALELFHSDNGYYPPSGCGWDCTGYNYSYIASGPTSWNTFYTYLAPYLGSMPVDPVNDSCPPWNDNCHSYTYGNVGRYAYADSYDLTTNLESAGHPNRCGAKGYKWHFTNVFWCTAFGGSYSDQIYEASIDNK